MAAQILPVDENVAPSGSGGSLTRKMTATRTAMAGQRERVRRAE